MLVVEHEPARRLGQLRDDGEEDDGVDLHGDDGDAPGPLVVLAELVREQHVDDEGHVEAEDVGLEFLGQGDAARVVLLGFGAVDRDDGVGAA